jgi:hypothetical protein
MRRRPVRLETVQLLAALIVAQIIAQGALWGGYFLVRSLYA